MDAIDDFFTDHLFVEDTGRRIFSTIFRKHRFLHLIIINSVIAALHEYILQRGKAL